MQKIREIEYTISDFTGFTAAAPENPHAASVQMQDFCHAEKLWLQKEDTMASFEELGKKISETGQSAAQKTKGLAEVIKLKYHAGDLNKALSNLYSEIGMLYFEKTKEAPEEDFKELFSKIDETVSEIEATEEKIRELKGVNVCPVCGAKVQNGKKFCGDCGARVLDEEPVQDEEAEDSGVSDKE